MCSSDLEAVMVFFNFLSFFAIFLEFSLPRREGTKRRQMKKYFNLTNGTQGYSINSISNRIVHFAAHILEGKMMIKNH